jgi:DNA-binding transcriptional ArsR family regulator
MNQAERLDRTFAALTDPSRRAILARLERDEQGATVSELAKPLPIKMPAVMKHLDVLAEAGLVARAKNGRTVSCRLCAEPMHEANEWLDRYQRFWGDRLDQLAAFLEEDSCPPSPSNQVSPSSAASTRRPPKSSKPGPTPKK